MKKYGSIKIIESVILVFAVLISTFAARAQSEEELAAIAKKSQNPVGDIVSIPLEYWHHGGIGTNGNGNANILMLKPVYPVSIGNLTLINRLIVPLIGISANNEDADLGELPGPFNSNKATGLGNIQYQAFFTKKDPGKIIVGLGPVVEIPTNTNNMGADKLSAGPSLIALTMPGSWVIGALAQNIWSFGSNDVNMLTFQYFVNYNIAKGWYLTTTPIITANWTNESGNQWTVPFGGGVGRMVKFGTQPVDFKLQAYGNVTAPNFGPDWTMMFAVKLLFPKKQD
jgi:hypothetical protein